MEEKSTLENLIEVKEDAKQKTEENMIVEEIKIEELSVDGICGVY